MKLAILGPAYPLRGGIAHYLALLDRAARGAGHEVFFASFAKQYMDGVPDWPLLRKLRFPGSSQAEAGATEIAAASTPLFVPWNPLSWHRTAAAIRNSGADLLVLKWWVPYFGPGYTAVARSLRRARIPAIAILDNVTPHERWPLARAVTRTGLASMSGFIAQSEAVRDELLQILPATPAERLRLVHHPTYDFGPGRAASQAAARELLGLNAQHVILFFGFIKPYKGLMVLIDAIPHLAELLGDTFQVVVVGDFYEDEAPYHARIQELGIARHLVLRGGYVPNDEVADYFIGSDVVALPYVTATQSGIVQIAYRYDRPVVATDVGGLPEFVDDGRTGYLVPPGDPRALAGALCRFLLEDDRQAFARHIADKRRDYSWDALVESVIELAGTH